MSTSRSLRFGAVACGAVGVALLAAGLWIPAKARLAQVLLERSFERARAASVDAASRAAAAPPWPWADFRPVARLSGPDGASQIVLDVASGEALAFGPGHLSGTAQVDGTSFGNVGLAGHRDTSFAFLEALRPGDRLELATLDGARVGYRVVWLRVVDRRDVSVLEPTRAPSLTLVTCWPFDRAVGGDERYIVRAVAEGVVEASSVLVFEREADLDLHLPMRDLAVLDLTAGLFHLEPAHVAHRLAGALHGVLDRMVEALSR